MFHPAQKLFARRGDHERSSLKSFQGDRQSNLSSASGSCVSGKPSKKKFMFATWFSKKEICPTFPSASQSEAEDPLFVSTQDNAIAPSHPSQPLRSQISTKLSSSTTLRSPPPPYAGTSFPTGTLTRNYDLSNNSSETTPRKPKMDIRICTALPPSHPTAASDFINKDAQKAALRGLGMIPRHTVNEQASRTDTPNSHLDDSDIPVKGPASEAEHIKEDWTIMSQKLERQEGDKSTDEKDAQHPSTLSSSASPPSLEISLPPSPISSPSPILRRPRESVDSIATTVSEVGTITSVGSLPSLSSSAPTMSSESECFTEQQHDVNAPTSYEKEVGPQQIDIFSENAESSALLLLPTPTTASHISTPTFFDVDKNKELRDGGVEAQQRVSVFGKGGVTMYNQAKIVTKLDRIEDEETRRLTESAFLI